MYIKDYLIDFIIPHSLEMCVYAVCYYQQLKGYHNENIWALLRRNKGRGERGGQKENQSVIERQSSTQFLF